MSHPKREHSEFSHSAVGRALARSKPTQTAPWELMDPAQLRVLESAEHKAVANGDPYNGVGARALSSRVLRR